MAIGGIFGNLSSGKTLFGAKICHDSYKSGVEVISNIKLFFPYERLSLDEMIDRTRKNPEHFKDKLLFVDEIHLIIDARRSSSDLNFKFTQFAVWLGKLNADLVFTSQLFTSQVDLRVRELCDFLFFCDRVDLNRNSIVGKRTVDQDILIKVIMVRKKYGGALLTKKVGYFDPKPYFNLYDTHELVLFDRDSYLKK